MPTTISTIARILTACTVTAPFVVPGRVERAASWGRRPASRRLQPSYAMRPVSRRSVALCFCWSGVATKATTARGDRLPCGPDSRRGLARRAGPSACRRAAPWALPLRETPGATYVVRAGPYTRPVTRQTTCRALCASSQHEEDFDVTRSWTRSTRDVPDRLAVPT